MSAAVDVQIVRPKKAGTESVGAVFGHIAGHLVNGWLLMLIVGTVMPWHPSYWHSVLVAFMVRSLTTDSSFYVWTKAAK